MAVDNEYEWTRVNGSDECLLAVDPGLNSCGWAFWNPEVDLVAPVAVGLIKPPRGASLGERMAFVAEKLLFEADCPEETYLVCEMPAFQAGASRELGWKTGDLQKLTLLVGYLSAHRWGRVRLVTPREWKGQLPKDVVTRRIQRKLGHDTCAALNIQKDGWDAVGIGLFVHTGTV